MSQVQNLLQNDALQSKPQLLETFDSALTGCRVVYGCLEEEVRELVVKADADELKFKDRAKFLWKEDTFKELLTQIRGQQSALSLLIQGLQMESIADIRKLVEENSVTLDEVVKRSRTLRQSHPRIRVPESLFNHEMTNEHSADAESIAKSTGFTFDDEVVNSKAYRRAMALYTSHIDRKDTQHLYGDETVDEPPAYAPLSLTVDHGENFASAMDDAFNKSTESKSTDEKRLEDTKSAVTCEKPLGGPETHTPVPPPSDNFGDAFESIEKDYLPYMPRITSTAPYLTPLRANTSSEATTRPSTALVHAPHRSYSESNLHPTSEEPPPLPPRRPSGAHIQSDGSVSQITKARSQSSDDGTDASTAPSVFSRVSTSSLATTCELPITTSVVSAKAVRKPLPLTRQISHDITGTIPNTTAVSGSDASLLSLRDKGMHNLWLSLLQSERNFIERLSGFRKMFYDNVVRSWPSLEKHLEAILVGEQLAAINMAVLLPMIGFQLSQNEEAVCDPSLFENYVNKANKVYREYCQKMPHAMASLRATQVMDPKFSPFVNTVGLSLAWLAWVGRTTSKYQCHSLTCTSRRFGVYSILPILRTGLCLLGK